MPAGLSRQVSPQEKSWELHTFKNEEPRSDRLFSEILTTQHVFKSDYVPFPECPRFVAVYHRFCPEH